MDSGGTLFSPLQKDQIKCPSVGCLETGEVCGEDCASECTATSPCDGPVGGLAEGCRVREAKEGKRDCGSGVSCEVDRDSTNAGEALGLPTLSDPLACLSVTRLRRCSSFLGPP